MQGAAQPFLVKTQATRSTGPNRRVPACDNPALLPSERNPFLRAQVKRSPNWSQPKRGAQRTRLLPRSGSHLRGLRCSQGALGVTRRTCNPVPEERVFDFPPLVFARDSMATAKYVLLFPWAGRFNNTIWRHEFLQGGRLKNQKWRHAFPLRSVQTRAHAFPGYAGYVASFEWGAPKPAFWAIGSESPARTPSTHEA